MEEKKGSKVAEKVLFLRRHTLTEGLKGYDELLGLFREILPTPFEPEAFKLTKVLTVTDGTDAGYRAVSAGLRIARRFEAAFMTLHIGQVAEKIADEEGKFTRKIEATQSLAKTIQNVSEAEEVNFIVVPTSIKNIGVNLAELLEILYIPTMFVY